MLKHNKHRSLFWIVPFVIIILLSIVSFSYSIVQEQFITNPNQKIDENYLLSRPTQNEIGPYLWSKPARLNSLYMNDMKSILFTNSKNSLEDLVLDTQKKAVDKCVNSYIYKSEKKKIHDLNSNLTRSITSAEKNISLYNNNTEILKNYTTDLQKNIHPVIHELFCLEYCLFTVDNRLTDFYIKGPNQSSGGKASRDNTVNGIAGDVSRWEVPKWLLNPSLFTISSNTVVSFATKDYNTTFLHQNTAGFILMSNIKVFSTHKDNWKYWTVFARNDSDISPPPKDKFGNNWYDINYNVDNDVGGWSSPVQSFSTMTLGGDLPDEDDYKIWASSANNSSTRTGNKYVWFRFKYITTH